MAQPQAIKDHQLPCNYRISIKALIRNAEGQILLIKEASESWGVPGGGLDHGETVEEGMRREVREELGAEMADMSPLPVLAAPYYYEEINRWRFWLLYAVTLATEPKIGESSAAIGWFNKAQLPTLELDKTEAEPVRDAFKFL